jgi:hypothetical protein
LQERENEEKGDEEWCVAEKIWKSKTKRKKKLIGGVKF